MWTYYGSKTAIVGLYPKPVHDKIIEPFAGTAKYSLRYFDRDVLLVDKYEVVINIWKWLQACSKGDILKLPRVTQSQTLDDFSFDCMEAKHLMGFLIAKGAERPRTKPTYRATTHRPNHINHSLNQIANSLFKIKHWEIVHGSFEDIANHQATWFVDPPYQYGGHAYVIGSKGINFDHLADYCRSRMGQVIVCENTKAEWLPFLPMRNNKGTHFTTTEAIWSNIQTSFDWQQQQLFRP